jgi:hypothetical protein
VVKMTGSVAVFKQDYLSTLFTLSDIIVLQKKAGIS